MVAEAEVWTQWELDKTGSTYRAEDPDRWDLPDVFDCSSLGIRGWRFAGLYVPDDVRNTVGIYEFAASVGALVSVDKAVATRGAGLLKGGATGFGPNGHYATSLGNGTEMAAHGTHSGVHPGPVNRGFYQDGIIFPPSMAHYAALDPPVDPKVLEALAAIEAFKHTFTLPDDGTGKTGPLRYGMTNGRVTTMNRFLIASALLDPKYARLNTYGKAPAAAVNHLKRLHPDIWKTRGSRDGKVFGSVAAAALLAPRAA